MTRGRVRRQNRRPSRTRFKVRHATDLLVLIPYLVGFHPSESVVALLTRSGQIAVTMRVDLPTTPSYEAAGEELGARLRAVGADQRAEKVALVAYSADPLKANRVLAAMMADLGDLELLDAYYVDGSRWWCLTCHGPCCPLEGTPYDLGSHEYAAEAVFAGMAAAPSREALRDSVRGPDSDEIPGLERTLVSVLDGLEELDDRDRASRAIQQTVRDHLGTAQVSDEVCARLALLAVDKTVRDHAWALITREDAEEHAELWRQVVARVSPVLSAGPLGLLGMAAWISGHGALQNVCGERLAEIHPDYTLGGILLDLSSRAVPPSAWESWASDMRREMALTTPEILTG